jgi:hypothetical protein
MYRTIVWAGALAGAALVLGACGSSHTTSPSAGSATTAVGAPDPNGTEVLPPGDIPDNQVFVSYSSPSGRYSLSYPQGWAQRQSGGTTTFTQYFNSIVVTSAPASRPTTSSVRSGDLAGLRALRGFKLVKIDAVTRTAGEAIRIVYDQTSQVDLVTAKSVTLAVERYLFWRNGVVVTVTLSSPNGSDNVDPWRTVTNSLVWK